jgi:hypothetical protein
MSRFAFVACSMLAVVAVLGPAASIPVATPAPAITFPSLTTIYVVSGVYDDGGAMEAGFATSVHCTNVSGQQAQVRFLFLSAGGSVIGTGVDNIPHGATTTVSTHATEFFEFSLATGAVAQGALNIESTESAVFCSAMIVEAGSVANSVALHMVRVNPHPGTVE